MSNENEFETALSGIPEETGPREVTLYGGRDSIERMMSGMAQEMMRGVERAGSRRILGSVCALRTMGCDEEEIRDRLINEYGVSPEEAEGFLLSAR